MLLCTVNVALRSRNSCELANDVASYCPLNELRDYLMTTITSRPSWDTLPMGSISSMVVASNKDLLRITEALEQVRGEAVSDAVIRSDCRQLRLTLEGGRMLLVSVVVDDNGRPRLDVDVTGVVQEPTHRQLEVSFEAEV